jgi:hypothetical protein
MKTCLFPSALPRSLSLASAPLKLAFAALLLAFLSGHSAKASPQYWDLNANGTWSTGAANFSPTYGGGSDAAFITGSDAIFSSQTVASTGTLTITTTALAANSVTFDGSTSTGYTFTSGGALTLGNATTGNNVITLNSGAGAVTFQGAIVLASPGTAQTYTISNNSSSHLRLDIYRKFRSGRHRFGQYRHDPFQWQRRCHLQWRHQWKQQWQSWRQRVPERHGIGGPFFQHDEQRGGDTGGQWLFDRQRRERPGPAGLQSPDEYREHGQLHQRDHRRYHCRL